MEEEEKAAGDTEHQPPCVPHLVPPSVFASHKAQRAEPLSYVCDKEGDLQGVAGSAPLACFA